MLSKCERRECLTGMKHGNKILRKYLPLCTRNFSISDYISLSHRVNCNKLKLCYDIEKSPGRDLRPLMFMLQKQLVHHIVKGMLQYLGEMLDSNVLQ